MYQHVYLCLRATLHSWAHSFVSKRLCLTRHVKLRETLLHQALLRQPQTTKLYRPSLSEMSRNQSQTKAQAQVTKVAPAELGKAKHVQRRRMLPSLQQTNFPSSSIMQDGKKSTSTHADQRQQMRTKFRTSKSRLPALGSNATTT